jgi:hypothetical protein
LPAPHVTVSAPSGPPEAAVEHVGAAGPGQRVGASIHGDDIQAGTAAHVARAHVIALAGDAVVRRLVERDAHAGSVVVRIAGDGATAAAGRHEVCAGAAEELRTRGGPCDEHVVAVAAVEADEAVRRVLQAVVAGACGDADRSGPAVGSRNPADDRPVVAVAQVDAHAAAVRVTWIAVGVPLRLAERERGAPQPRADRRPGVDELH